MNRPTHPTAPRTLRRAALPTALVFALGAMPVAAQTQTCPTPDDPDAPRRPSIWPAVEQRGEVAVAADPLLDRAAEETAGSTIFLDAVSGEVSAARLEAHGLKIARTLQRMTRPATPLDQGASVVAAMGFEWG